ncbi:MAG: hypothetical protein JNL35_14170 [Sphingopyxis sp.]|nr:hypothetical protein [Sphingopyxis sp.]
MPRSPDNGSDVDPKTITRNLDKMFQNNNIFPALPALSLAGKAMTATPKLRRRATLSRRELRRLIADMID